MSLDQAMPFGNVRNGQTDVAAAGTPQPLLGTYYSASKTCTIAEGSTVMNGGSTAPTWTAVMAGMWMVTAGGYRYQIMEFRSATQLIVSPAGLAAETNQTFRIYERPCTAEVHIWNMWGERGNTGGIWFGVFGASTSLTFDKTTNAYPLALGEKQVLTLDLASTDLWVDAATNGNDVNWLLLW